MEQFIGEQIRKHYYGPLGDIRIWENGEVPIYQAYDIKSDDWVLFKIERNTLYAQWAYTEFWVLVDQWQPEPVAPSIAV